jgi:hypothetical protein
VVFSLSISEFLKENVTRYLLTSMFYGFGQGVFPVSMTGAVAVMFVARKEPEHSH